MTAILSTPWTIPGAQKRYTTITGAGKLQVDGKHRLSVTNSHERPTLLFISLNYWGNGSPVPVMNYRKALLEEILNSEVIIKRKDIFEWRGFYFQVLPYSQIKKGWSQFVKKEFKSRVFGVRELTPKMREKLLDI